MDMISLVTPRGGGERVRGGEGESLERDNCYRLSEARV